MIISTTTSTCKIAHLLELEYRFLGMSSLLLLILFLTPTLKQLPIHGGFDFLAVLARENRLFELRDNRMPTSVPAPNTRTSLIKANKQVLALLPLQLLHAYGLRHQDVEEACSLLSQGKWKQLWEKALARAAAQRAKTEENPAVERQRTSKEKDVYARKCATAGNLSKACKIVCQEQIAACR